MLEVRSRERKEKHSGEVWEKLGMAALSSPYEILSRDDGQERLEWGQWAVISVFG